MQRDGPFPFDLNDLPNGVLLVKDGSGIMAANTAMLALLDCDADWLIGRPLSSIMTRPAAMLYHSSVYVQLRAKGTVRETYFDFRDKSGLDVPVLCTASLRQTAGDAVITISATRMTERRRLEEDLLRTRRIFEQIPGVVYQYLVRADGTHAVPYASEALRSMFGLGPSQVQNDATPLLGKVHPDDREAICASIQDSIRTLQTWRHQFRARRGDDSPWRWIEGHASPERQADGATRWHGFVQDVTDRKAVEDELRDKHAAEQANRAKSEFLARVSHELRTPLNAILGFAQILGLEKKTPLAPLQRHRVHLIEEAGRDLLTLIEEVMDITRIESGAVTLNPVWLDADTLLTRVARLVEEPARQRGIRLSMNAPPGLCIEADQARLGQVLTNLMSNAVKYTKERGAVTVTCSTAEGQVCIAVHDNGPGMSQDQLDHLFEPFNRLGAERTTVQGTGLGLVIVKRLVEAMGGSMRVRSNPVDGTTFEVALPHTAGAAAPAPRVPHVAAPGTPPAARRSATLLYVEDNAVNAMVMETILEMGENITLHVESTGEAGIAWLQQHHADAVLLDMNLPDYDGISLLKAMRERCERQPVAIAVSADAMPSVVEDAKAAGFAQYWTKPLDVEQTLSRLAEALEGAGARPQVDSTGMPVPAP